MQKSLPLTGRSGNLSCIRRVIRPLQKWRKPCFESCAIATLLERYHLKVVDIRDPSAILPPDILAAPTVVRTFPQPGRRVIGDLSATEKAVEGLGLQDALVEA